jgi:hypothetical protein
MFGALVCFWLAGAKRVVFWVAGIMVLGLVVFLFNAKGRSCGAAWFCDLIPSTLMASLRCPDDDEQVSTRIFTEEYVDAEVHRLISTGVCQADAIERIHIGWGAKFSPEYLSRHGRRVP